MRDQNDGGIARPTPAPPLSVLLITPDTFDTIRRTARFLRAQTACKQIELLIVAPSREALGAFESDVEGFHDVRVVEVGPIEVLAQAKLEAIKLASAPVIAFAEDHCFPEPEWAAALIAAHERECAAVGPMMVNGNPRTMASCIAFVLHFGCCAGSAAARPAEHLPWHNTSFKRDLLLEFEGELDFLLLNEGILLERLRTKGHVLYLDPAARTNHVNISLLSSWYTHAFWGGRLYGSARAREYKWSPVRKLAYIAGSPLVPLLRLRRAVAQIRELGLGSRLLPRSLPLLVTGLIVHAFGEATGYALGFGDAPRRYSYFESRRIRHLVPEDRALVLE
jgi:hypothetical protein